MSHNSYCLYFYLCTAVLFAVAKCYYLTANWMTVSQGIDFCVNYCNSNIASILNNESYTKATKTIESILAIEPTNENVFIGLSYRSTTQSFEWIDGSPFSSNDFGYNTSGSHFPWYQNEPRDSVDGYCTQIGVNKDVDYRWETVLCQSKNRILCNDCSGKLNKYFVVNDNSASNWTIAKAKCEQFNTTLAGIHSIRDQRAAQMFADILYTPTQTLTDNLWIGYYDIGPWPENNFRWENGMPGQLYAQFNGGWPWRSSRPDDPDGSQNCVLLEWSGIDQEFLWNDKQCTDSFQALCNMPSELCEFVSNWTVISGNAQFDDCELYMYDSTAMMAEKRWQNMDNILIIDYAHSMNDITNSTKPSKSGLIISECQNPFLSICEYYFIGIIIINNTQQTLNLEFHHSDTMDLLSEIMLPINSSVYFLMETKIDSDVLNNMLLFNISIEYNSYSDRYITYNHDRNGTLLFDTYSGYIGIISENTQVHAKSLYVSGTPLLSSFTSNPTTIPTTQPTSQSTDQPTGNPSLAPISKTTKEPTNQLTYGPIFATPSQSTLKVIIEIELTSPDINPENVTGTVNQTLKQYFKKLSVKATYQLDFDTIETTLLITVHISNLETDDINKSELKLVTQNDLDSTYGENEIVVVEITTGDESVSQDKKLADNSIIIYILSALILLAILVLILLVILKKRRNKAIINNEENAKALEMVSEQKENVMEGVTRGYQGNDEGNKNIHVENSRSEGSHSQDVFPDVDETKQYVEPEEKWKHAIFIEPTPGNNKDTITDIGDSNNHNKNQDVVITNDVESTTKGTCR